VSVPLEVAVSGHELPLERLSVAGWRVRNAHQVTSSFDSFRAYLGESAGEFSVCKNGYVATACGWFSDRGAAYLASGRPVVQQETGFSRHLPCGEGLFAVADVDEATAAIEEIASSYDRHAKAAREIAVEHLDARRVLGAFLEDLGL
jgi:glycosyltransferase involved in cell wall biosynthesis